MAKAAATDRVTGLEAEIMGEKLATYVRIARSLERLVAETESARREADRATGGRRRECVARFNELRQRAERHLWYLLVQREALGLRHDCGIERLYPIPAPMRPADG